MKKLSLFIIALVSFSCMPLVTLLKPAPTATPSPLPTQTSSPLPTETYTPLPTLTPTSTYTPTETSTPTYTPTNTNTPTSTSTPSPLPTSTSDLPTFVVAMQAHCRYGPAKAFLHAADLYAGDTGTVWGRYRYSNFLYVKLDKLSYPCWLAPSVVTVTGDISILRYQEYNLPGPSVLYGPPASVSATRSGDQVTITWSSVYMTEDDDRGYQLDLFVCQDGRYLWWPVSFPDQYTTSYTVTDQAGCPVASTGRIATVEKHGYTTWETIFWPAP